ncbi:MAG: prepilin-type N-terminal cleavage/methylation domain-containing protein [Pseudomonadota bacterium]
MENNNKQGGITLVEVIVTLSIFSFGLLALAKLQINYLNKTYVLYYNSIALEQLNSIEARLRVDAKFSNFELQQWNSTNRRLLPQGQGELLGNKITLKWYDKYKKQWKISTTQLNL